MSALLEEKETKQGATSPPVRRRYSDEEKAEALASLDANEGRLTLTAEMLGIPVQTLHCWDMGRGVHPSVMQLRTHKKEELANELDSVALLAARLAGEKVTGASFKDTMIGLGIAVEKAALLRGEATANVGHVETLQTAQQALDRLFELARERQPDITREQVRARLVARRPELATLLLPE